MTPEPGPGSSQAPPPFSTERGRRDGAVVITLHGELDLHTADLLLAAAADLATGQRLVLDLSDLGFIDSAGLRALMNLDLRARGEGWTIALAAPAPVVLRLLKLTGFDKRIAILDATP